MFGFAIASVAGFALPASLARRYAPAMRMEASDGQLITAGIANVVAVSACLGEVAGISQLAKWLAWPLAGIVVVTTYFMIVALQHALSS